jgi:four helix bundle protein
LYGRLPASTVAQVLGKQLLRSGTSVGAQYREASRARSIAEFVSKMESGLQELDETAYWLELMAEAGVAPEPHLAPLRREANELIAMMVTATKTAKAKR